MALGRRRDSGNLGKLNWDFDIGNFVLEDRIYSNGEWENQQRNVKNDKFRGVFDLPNGEIGWIAYLKGEGLNAKLVHIGENYGDPPTDKHKEGFRLIVRTDESLGGDSREFISTSTYLWTAIDRLHDDFVAGSGEHPGCLPVVDVADVRKEMLRSRAALLVPVFKIVFWSPRPLDLPASGIPLIRRVKKAGNDSEPANGGSGTHPSVKDDFKDSIPF
jgi:hypothetical protein